MTTPLWETGATQPDLGDKELELDSVERVLETVQSSSLSYSKLTLGQLWTSCSLLSSLKRTAHHLYSTSSKRGCQ